MKQSNTKQTIKQTFQTALSVLLLCAVCLMPLGVSAEGGIQVLLNGTPISFDQPPVILDGRTMVPLRAIFEAIGADVYWVEQSQLIVGVKNDTKVFLQVGEDALYRATLPVGGAIGDAMVEEVYLDVPPVILSSRTLVPVRAIADAFGAQVSWDEASQVVGLTMPAESVADRNRDSGFFTTFYDTFYGEYPIRGNLLFLDATGSILLDNRDFTNAEVVSSGEGAAIELTLSAEGLQRLRDAALRLQGMPSDERMISVVLDDMILAVLDPELLSGTVETLLRLDNGYSRQQAEELVQLIVAGSVEA